MTAMDSVVQAVQSESVPPQTARPRTVPRRVTPKDLPMWPLWLFFCGYPVMWVLGLSGFATQIAAVPMAACLLTAGHIRHPRGFGVWLLYVIWMLFSVVEVSGAGRLLGFGYRASLYIAATVAFIYVYNTSPARLPLSRLCAMATTFLGFVILGGFLGIIAPHGSLTTPLEHVTPGSLLRNDLVGKLLHPPFAQVSHSAVAHVDPRPAAPFPYTNDWGANFALLVPFVVAWLSLTKRVRTRVALIAILVIGLVPALISLNRGMALGLGVGIIYVAIRFALRGHGRALLGVLVVGGIIVGLMSALHFTSRLDERLSNSSTNQGRVSTYSATYDQTLHSPVLGYGAPTSSTINVNDPDLGTQGQLWTVLYSSGFPGAIFFTLSLIGFAWATRRPKTPAMMWMHVVPIIGLVVYPVYQLQASALLLLMVAAAIAWRDRPVTVRPVAVPASARVQALATASG